QQQLQMQPMQQQQPLISQMLQQPFMPQMQQQQPMTAMQLQPFGGFQQQQQPFMANFMMNALNCPYPMTAYNGMYGLSPWAAAHTALAAMQSNAASSMLALTQPPQSQQPQVCSSNQTRSIPRTPLDDFRETTKHFEEMASRVYQLGPQKRQNVLDELKRILELNN
ncbi:hypothetical protein PENTCL1PPCAC_12000, partial [Pristionchus entomophagus]